LLNVVGNGLIDFDEFCEMMQGRLSTQPSSPGVDDLGNDFRSLFMAFDKDNNGYIDGEELRQTMSAVGLQLSDRDVAMMMTAAGVPSGGRIYYEGESLTAVFRDNYNSSCILYFTGIGAATLCSFQANRRYGVPDLSLIHTGDYIDSPNLVAGVDEAFVVRPLGRGTIYLNSLHILYACVKR